MNERGGSDGKKGYCWGYAPDRRTKPKVPDDLKKEVQTKADDLVEKVLRPKYIKPPPEKSEWNYPIGEGHAGFPISVSSDGPHAFGLTCRKPLFQDRCRKIGETIKAAVPHNAIQPRAGNRGPYRC